MNLEMEKQFKKMSCYAGREIIYCNLTAREKSKFGLFQELQIRLQESGRYRAYLGLLALRRKRDRPTVGQEVRATFGDSFFWLQDSRTIIVMLGDRAESM